MSGNRCVNKPAVIWQKCLGDRIVIERISTPKKMMSARNAIGSNKLLMASTQSSQPHYF